MKYLKYIICFVLVNFIFNGCANKTNYEYQTDKCNSIKKYPKISSNNSMKCVEKKELSGNFLKYKYNEFGYDDNGFDKNEIHYLTNTIFDLEGYDKNGYDNNHNHKDKIEDEFKKFCIERKGKIGWDFNLDLINCSINNEKIIATASGYKKILNIPSLFNEEGYDKEGLDKEGLDKEGFNQYGFNSKGINKSTKTQFDKFGFNKEGYDKEGYNKNGFNKNGYNKIGLNKDGLTAEQVERKKYYEEMIALERQKLEIERQKLIQQQQQVQEQVNQQSLQNLRNNLQMQQLNNNLMMNNLMPKRYDVYVH